MRKKEDNVKLEEKEEKEFRRSYRPEDEKDRLKRRLTLLTGQINGVYRMLEDDRYIDDILIQLLALDKAIKSFANVMIERHLYNEVLKDESEKSKELVNELMIMFKKFQD